jgi:hypothetical protein
MSGGGSSPAPAPQKTTTTAEPWADQKPFLKTIFKEAEKQYNEAGPEFFPGQTFVPLDPLQDQAQNQLLSFAQNGAQQQADNVAAAQNFSLGAVIDPASNPALQAHAQGAISPIYEALTQQALPAVRNEAVTAGGYGGSRQGIAEALAITNANRIASDTTASIYNDAYKSGLEQMGRALALAPQTLQVGTYPSTLTESVGGQRRALDQASLDEQIQRFNYEQAIEGAKLAQFSNLVQGNYGGTTTGQIAGLPGAQKNLGASIIGGGLAGLGAGPALSSMLGITGPWGYGLGAGLGILSGLF